MDERKTPSGVTYGAQSRAISPLPRSTSESPRQGEPSRQARPANSLRRAQEKHTMREPEVLIGNSDLDIIRKV